MLGKGCWDWTHRALGDSCTWGRKHQCDGMEAPEAAELTRGSQLTENGVVSLVCLAPSGEVSDYHGIEHRGAAGLR